MKRIPGGVTKIHVAFSQITHQYASVQAFLHFFPPYERATGFIFNFFHRQVVSENHSYQLSTCTYLD